MNFYNNFIKTSTTSFVSDLTNSRFFCVLLSRRMFPTCLTACPAALPLNVGRLAGLLCTFGSCPTHFLSGGHHRHFALIARRSPTECSLFVCLFASLPELLVIYSPFLAGGNSGSQCLDSLNWQRG